MDCATNIDRKKPLSHIHPVVSMNKATIFGPTKLWKDGGLIVSVMVPNSEPGFCLLLQGADIVFK